MSPIHPSDGGLDGDGSTEPDDPEVEGQWNGPRPPRSRPTSPLHSSDRAQRSLGSLVPDIVVRRRSSVNVIDAKYKAHLAEIDESGWRRMGDEVREAHRADLHQVLAYAALYQAEEITATLVYPLRPSTHARLRAQGRDRSVAELLHGGRTVRLELRGLPFGRVA